MCGILGFSGEDSKALRRMMRSLAHRGPDDEGTFCDGNASLGHLRLSIIDLSRQGHQPMRRGKLVITYNGEIYNYKEVRASLEKTGKKFSSKSDTEVILAAYEQWGEKCVEKFNGMFALCIYDEQKKRLFLSRDRFGQKPLYYTVHEGVFVFASEIKALLAYTQQYDLNKAFVPYLLAYRYVPSSVAVFKGIKKLGAGTTAIYDLKTKKLVTQRYWSLAYEPKQSISMADAAEKLRSKIEKAVQYTLVSDVPVGLFLSGGTDSSVIAHHAAKLSPHIKTFTIGSRDEGHDESKYAQVVADAYGTEHRTFYLTSKQFINGLREMYKFYDTPYLSTSSVTLYSLAKQARKHVKVALSGEGGDEHFAGYTRYLWYNRLRSIPRAAKPAVHAAATIAGILKPSLKGRGRSAAQAVGKLGALRYATIANPVDEDSKALVEGLNDALFLGYKEHFNHKEELDNALAADVNIYLESDLLLKLDTSAMAHNLEGRVPFLDHELSEWVAKLPASLKLHNKVRKAVLQQAYKKLLPKVVLARPKSGFGLPLHEFMRGEGKAILEASLGADAALFREDLVNSSEAKRLLAGFKQKGKHEHAIYALFHLEQFLQSLPEKVR